MVTPRVGPKMRSPLNKARPPTARRRPCRSARITGRARTRRRSQARPKQDACQHRGSPAAREARWRAASPAASAPRGPRRARDAARLSRRRPSGRAPGRPVEQREHADLVDLDHRAHRRRRRADVARSAELKRAQHFRVRARAPRSRRRAARRGTRQPAVEHHQRRIARRRARAAPLQTRPARPPAASGACASAAPAVRIGSAPSASSSAVRRRAPTASCARLVVRRSRSVHAGTLAQGASPPSLNCMAASRA